MFCCDYARSGSGSSTSDSIITFDQSEEQSTLGAVREVGATLHEVLLVLGEEDGCMQEWGFNALCQAIEQDKWDASRYKEVWQCLAGGSDRLKGTLLRIWFDHNYCIEGKNPEPVLARMRAKLPEFRQLRAQREVKRNSALVAAKQAVAEEQKMQALQRESKQAPWDSEATQRRAELKKLFLTLDPNMNHNTQLSSKQLAVIFGALLPKDQALQQKMSQGGAGTHTVRSFLDWYTPQMESLPPQDWSTHQLAFKRAVLELKLTPRGGASAPVNPASYSSPSPARLEGDSPGRTRSEKEYMSRLVQLRTLFRFFDVSNAGTIALSDISAVATQQQQHGSAWLDPALLAERPALLTMDMFLEIHQTPLKSCSDTEWQAGFTELKRAAIGIRRKSPRARSRPNSPSRKPVSPPRGPPGGRAQVASTPPRGPVRRGGASPSPLDYMGR